MMKLVRVFAWISQNDQNLTPSDLKMNDMIEKSLKNVAKNISTLSQKVIMKVIRGINTGKHAEIFQLGSFNCPGDLGGNAHMGTK